MIKEIGGYISVFLYMLVVPYLVFITHVVWPVVRLPYDLFRGEE